MVSLWQRFALSEELLQQDRSLSLQWSVQQLRQLVKDHNHCLPVEDTLSPKELQTVLKMHAHQHKLSRIVTPTIHHSPVGSSFRTDHFNLGKFGLHAPSSSDDAKSDPKCAQDLTSTSSDEYSKKSNNNSEVHSDIAVAQLSSAELLFLQELPDLTFLLWIILFICIITSNSRMFDQRSSSYQSRISVTSVNIK